jgi:hypothetical protein
MKIVTIGEGAKVEQLKANENIIVTNGISQVVVVDIGKNVEVINLDANENQVLTPEAYRDYLKNRVDELRPELKDFSEQLQLLKNDIERAKINRQLIIVQKELNEITAHDNGKVKYSRALSALKEICTNLGYGILAGIITNKLGF